MRWTEVESAWNELTDGILGEWPEMCAEKLAGLAGNRNAFAAHIAETYELTLNEASELIDEWLLRIAARLRIPQDRAA